MATRPKAVIESRNGEKFSPITIAKNVLTDDGQNLHDILSDRKEDMMTPTIENSSSMFKVGQGDNVDYSSNVVNGAYESMILKGKTMVNCIQEPSSQDVVLPYVFEDGQYVTINDTKESGALGVKLKGQTLVNLAKKSTYKFSYHSDEASKYTFTSELNRVSITINEAISQWRYSLLDLRLNMLKPNTKYFVKFEGNFKGSVTIKAGDSSGALTNSVGIDNNNYVIITTNDLSSSIGGQGLFFFPATPNQYPHTYTLANVVLIEYQDGMENWDIPYFEGIQSVKMPILKSVNQLFDYSLITAPGGSLSFTNDGRKIRVDFNTRRDCYQHVDLTIPSGAYNVSFEVRGKLSSVSNMDIIHSSKLGLAFVGESNSGWFGDAPKIGMKYIDLSQSEFTTVTKSFTFDESKKLTIYYHGWNDNPVGWCEFRNIRIVPQSKTSILSTPEDLELRGIGNVKDELNVATGELTQRIGEIVLDGVNYKCIKIVTNGDETKRFDINFTFEKFVGANSWIDLTKMNASVICDKAICNSNGHSVHPNKNAIASFNGILVLFIEDNTILTIEKANEWLQQNPLTVQYELATPVVTKINLPSTLKSWNTTTHIYSEIPENTLYPTLSHTNPTYPVIIKPSTKYSIVANSYSNGHTNSAINFNLGGATASTTVGNRVTTITTPSTLSNELLTMSGRGNKLNNVMVIEGDVAGDEPYFEGMCDSKSPILSNVGKNLWDIDKLNDAVCTNKTNDSFVLKSWASTVLTNQQIREILKPNTKYTMRAKFRLLKGSSLPSYSQAIQFLLYAPNETSTNVSFFLAGSTHTIGEEYEVTNTFTTPSDFTTKNLLGYSKRYANDSTVELGEVEFTDVQLEEMSQATEYEPHKSNTTTFDQKDGKTIVLRSLPNGVCDTLNVKTGEYVQIIGEITLDGTKRDDLVYHTVLKDNDGDFIRMIINGCSFYDNNKYGNCDKLPFYHEEKIKDSVEAVFPFAGEKHFYIKIKTSRINGAETMEDNSNQLRDAFLNWLAQNPITVQYQLATPIVKQINVEGYPYAYENGHVLLESGSQEQSLTPTIEYSIVANRGGQIRSNQRMVERHQKQLDRLQAMVLTNLVNTQYEQTLTNLKYDLKNVREEVK